MSYVHIYCGDGKGKTTAATGLAVRAAGSGMKVLFLRFLKNEDSAELKILDQIENIDRVRLDKSFGFYKFLSDEEKCDLKAYCRERWNLMVQKSAEGSYTMVVLDELISVVNYQMIPEGEVIRYLKERSPDIEVVMTGRDPGEILINAADYVSEVRKIKHPYDQGITARKGIEY